MEGKQKLYEFSSLFGFLNSKVVKGEVGKNFTSIPPLRALS